MHEAKQKHVSEEKQVGAAFSDLQSLMKEAQAMVDLAKRISTAMQAKEDAGGAEANTLAADNQEFAALLRDLGLDAALALPAAPIVKAAAVVGDPKSDMPPAAAAAAAATAAAAAFAVPEAGAKFRAAPLPHAGAVTPFHTQVARQVSSFA